VFSRINPRFVRAFMIFCAVEGGDRASLSIPSIDWTSVPDFELSRSYVPECKLIS
jgi:hypothetical protein